MHSKVETRNPTDRGHRPDAFQAPWQNYAHEGRFRVYGFRYVLENPNSRTTQERFAGKINMVNDNTLIGGLNYVSDSPIVKKSTAGVGLPKTAQVSLRSFRGHNTKVRSWS